MLWLGRHPRDYRQAIGAKLDRHCFLCADTRTGKGRTFFLNNGALWDGSYINITPKPEDTDILAEQRSKGKGQDTFALDPFRVSRIDDSLRGYWNPIEDMSEARALRDARRMCSAMVVEAKSGESQDWQDKGAELVAVVAADVKTNPVYKDEERHLGTVRRLILAGKKDDLQAFRELRKAGKIEDYQMPEDGFELLFSQIRQSTACDGMLSDLADSFDELRIGHSKGWQSVRKAAQDITQWLDDPDMVAQISGQGFAPDRKLNIDRIKTDPTGVSVFICLPTAEKKTSAPWQRMLMEMMLHRFKELPQPATGRKVLMSVDEFLSYGRVESILDSMTEIAGAGVGLILGVQNVERLEEIYGKAWHTFPGSAGLSLWFGLDAKETIKHVSEMLGEQEICKLTRSENESESTTITTSKAQTSGSASAQAVGQSEAYGGSNGSTTSISYSTGQQRGSNSGTTYRGGMLLDFLPSTSNGRSSGKSTGKQTGKTEQISNTWQTSKNLVETRTTNESTTLTYSDGRTVQLGRGWSETFNKRPLLSIDELRIHFGKKEDPNDPLHPGLMIVLEASTPPYVVRRSNIDQDPFFIGKFTPHHEHPFVPVKDQPMLEYMYGPQHHYGLQMPLDFQNKGYRIRPARGVELGQHLKSGQTMLQVFGPASSRGYLPEKAVATVRAPCPMTLVHQDEDPEQPLSVIVRRLGRTPLPAKPFKRLNYDMVKSARDHRKMLKRQEAEEEARRRAQRDREIREAEAARIAELRNARKAFITNAFWWVVGISAFAAWVSNG